MASPFRKSLFAVAIAALSLGGFACATTDTGNDTSVATAGGSFGTTAGAIGTMDQSRSRMGVPSTVTRAHGSTTVSGTTSTATHAEPMAAQPPNVDPTTTDGVDTVTTGTTSTTTTTTTTTTTPTTPATATVTTTATTTLDDDATAVRGEQTRRTVRKD